jgi:hypothetical protein
LQALHMRTLLGFLLARDERLEEADAVMAEVQPLWVARVDPSDPWLQDIELVRLTIRAGLGVAALESAPPVGEARLRLVEYERAILAHVQRLKGQSNGLQLRRLALVRLRQMYSDSCFANAEWEKWSVDVLRILNQDVIDRRVADDTGAASRAAASPALQAGVVEGDTEP